MELSVRVPEVGSEPLTVFGGDVERRPAGAVDAVDDELALPGGEERADCVVPAVPEGRARFSRGRPGELGLVVSGRPSFVLTGSSGLPGSGSTSEVIGRVGRSFDSSRRWGR